MANRPKPTAIKKLEGNRGHRPLPENEPQPDRTPPKCPAWLDSEAKREWRRVVPEMERLGLLTVVDRAALAGYCQAWSRWRRAETELQSGFSYEFVGKDFKTKRTKKPEVQIAMDSLAQVRAFCAEFGLTPSSRGRMNVATKAPEQDPLDEMLGTCQN